MEPKTQDDVQETGNNQIYYILGAVVLVVIVVAGYLLRSKSNPQQVTSPTTTVNTPVVATPTPGPITGLACTRQYYNPVIGLPKYYVSVEGVDVSPATKVECTFNISVAGKTVADATATSELVAAPERNGSTFRCTTKQLELTPSVASKIDVALKDDQNKTSSCTASFSLPKP